MTATHYGKKSKNKLQGKLRQKSKGGNYYYRLMITAGTRKEFTLGASNYDEAVLKAMELDSIWLAPCNEKKLDSNGFFRTSGLEKRDRTAIL